MVNYLTVEKSSIKLDDCLKFSCLIESNEDADVLVKIRKRLKNLFLL